MQPVPLSKKLRSKIGLEEGEDLYRRVLFDTELKSLEESGHRFHGILSNDSPDEEGEVMIPKGADLVRFVKNPIMLWSHGWFAPPLGTWDKVTQTEHTLEGDGVFAKKPDDWSGGIWRPDEIRGLVNQKPQPVVRAISIGFVRKVFGEPTDEDIEQNPSWKKVVKLLTKVWKLLEGSLVSLPCNEDALVTAVLKGLVSDDLAKEFDYTGSIPVDALVAAAEFIIDGDKASFGSHPAAQRALAVIKHAGLTPEAFSEARRIHKQSKGGQGSTGNSGLTDFDESSLEESGEKPYPNEHACRLNDPGKYDKFGRKTRKHEGKVYSVIFGRIKGKNKWEEQAYRYKKATWKADAARSHCKSHGGSFEAASSSQMAAFYLELAASRGIVHTAIDQAVLQAEETLAQLRGHSQVVTFK